MTTKSQKDWTKDFGLDDRRPPHFFSSADQLDETPGKVPQAHVLRRAFEQFEIDGVLCQERSPVIYFRQVKTIDPADIIKLHRSFWNQGVAPILVVIAPNEVRVYSGLIPPTDAPTEAGKTPGLVETINRVQDRLRSFLLSVESGEYFHVHQRSFDPGKRVDRELLRNLQATRKDLGQVEAARLEPQVLDALLCRLIFTCYLFDRGVIDRAYLKTIRIHGADHLKGILAKTSKTDAKTDLYNKLFGQLGTDFNGDLFSADLEAEGRQIKVEHLEILDRFFNGTDVRSKQRAFWPYDFGIIPIETISAIYEHFLKAAGEEAKKEAGAFYTPRFLADFVLDVALEGETSLLDKRFLDPACGSGIFLVGLFNRLAEEWKLRNPGARYDRRANGLMDVLTKNLYGVDRNRSACQITAFSLYLAFLDQLSPPDIQKLLGKWDRLPHLVSVPSETQETTQSGTIRCADFFSDAANPPQKVDFVVGNPPWGSEKDRQSLAARWCANRSLPHPDRQMATAFIWKAPSHLADGGKVCFVLPHGTLFNHNDTAIRFQQSLFRTHAVDRVVNLTDYQFFLFEESRAPALVIRYRKEKPAGSAHLIDYWAPKTDWVVTQAEIITIRPQDRARVTVREVLDDLGGADGPLIWKERFWATPRDRRLLDRLSRMPRLRAIVAQSGRAGEKRWLIAEGFQPLGENDDPSKGQMLDLPSTLFVEATARELNLFLLEDDCKLRSQQVAVRARSNKNTDVFKAPHVLVTKGVGKDSSHVAFADFDVSFRHALRGIHGPPSDRGLLIFLAAYLRSDLARFFLFHTSSNWGVSRAEVHVEELLRLPFPLPDAAHNPKRCRAIVSEIVAAVTNAAEEASRDFSDRSEIVRRTQEAVGTLIEEYFDVDESERMLIADTAKITIPSIRPSRGRPDVPTMKLSNNSLRTSYTEVLCATLNSRANKSYQVHGTIVTDTSLGIDVVVLEKTYGNEGPTHLNGSANDLLKAIDNLQRTASRGHGAFELVRGLKVFHENLLYITKPLAQRFWTNTAALNDADEIAATILARSAPGGIVTIGDPSCWDDFFQQNMIPAVVPSVVEFQSPLDALIAEKMRRFPLLGGDLPDRWNVRFRAGFHKTDEGGLFRDAPAKGRLPLYEGRMIWQFDHRLAEPRYWVDEIEGRSAYLGRERDDGKQLPYESSRIAFRSAARTTNERTMVATVLPPSTFCEHSLNVSTGVSSAADQMYLAAVLNSFVFDFALRARVSKNLTLPLLYQMPVPRLPSNVPSRAPIVERAARLICTTPEFDDMAKEVGIKSHRHGVTDPATRASLRAELDGLVADLYGLSESEFAHILSTFPRVPDPVKVAAQNAYRDLERGLIR